MTYRNAMQLALLVLPWLNPFAAGPTPEVQPWLLAFGCGTLLWLSRRHLSANLILQGWVLGAAASAMIGLLQYWGWSDQLWPWLARAQAGEAYGNLRQRNQLATLTNIGLVALIGWSAGLDPGRKLQRAGIWLAIMLLMAGNAASASRTGLLQLLLLACLAMVWGQWRHAYPRQLLAIAFLAYAAASIVLPLTLGGGVGFHDAWSRLRAGDDACNGRLVLWKNVIHLIATKPWTGWGWGELDYAHFMTLYPGPRFCEILDNAHNLPLHLAVELGLPAALLLCAAGGVLLWRSRPWRETLPDRQAAWAVMALILLHSMLEYPLWYGPFQMALVLCFWLLRRPGRPPEFASSASARMAWEGGLAISLLVFGAYAAWDYHRVSQIYLAPAQRDAVYREHTLEKIQPSWLFRKQVRFAEFSITPLTRDNAARLHTMGQELLHYSPEASVVEKLIESAVVQGQPDEASYYLSRLKAAYPQEHARWLAARNALPLPPATQ